MPDRPWSNRRCGEPFSILPRSRVPWPVSRSASSPSSPLPRSASATSSRNPRAKGRRSSRWPSASLAGAKPVPIRAADEDGFVPSTETVADAITPRTRLIVLNSPSNPAGSVYSRSQMRGLADLAADHDLTVVSDEIYEKILYEGEHVSPASLEGMFDRTITVNGFSKTYSMTGWRLGWLVAPTPLYPQIVKVQEHTITFAN